MTTDALFMQLSLESSDEHACIPPVPEGLDQYIRIAMPAEVDSSPEVFYSTGYHTTPHVIPLCIRYSVLYTHEMEELTFTLRDVRTGHSFVGPFASRDPSPVEEVEDFAPEPHSDDSVYPPRAYVLQMPRTLIYTLNVAYYVDLPLHSAVYDVTVNSRDIVSNVCRVALVRHN